MKSHDKNSRAILGLILIAVGTILIVVNLGWIPHAISDMDSIMANVTYCHWLSANGYKNK